MRFTEDQVRQALQHSDKEVRFAALQYFAKSYSTKPGDHAGCDRTGGTARTERTLSLYSFPIADLAQTRRHNRLGGEAASTRSRERRRRLHRPHRTAVVHADPMLVLPHKAAILSIAGPGSESLASAFEHRLGLISMPSDQLWQRLEAICEAGKDKMYPNEIPDRRSRGHRRGPGS